MKSVGALPPLPPYSGIYICVLKSLDYIATDPTLQVRRKKVKLYVYIKLSMVPTTDSYSSYPHLKYWLYKQLSTRIVYMHDSYKFSFSRNYQVMEFPSHFCN